MLKISLLNINTQTENKIALGSMLPVKTKKKKKIIKKMIKPAYSAIQNKNICNFSIVIKKKKKIFWRKRVAND